MGSANFACPTLVVSDGDIIYASERNAEFTNISTNFNPTGMSGYQDTLAQKKLQEDPATGLVTSLAKEVEQLRFAINRILGNKTWWYEAPDAGLDDVAAKADGAASSTDNALARFDSTTGKVLQNSVGILEDTGNLSGIADLTATGALSFGTINSTNADKVIDAYTRSIGSSVGVRGVAVSGSCGSFTTTSSSYVDVTNLSVQIVTSGRPVELKLINNGSGQASFGIQADFDSATSGIAYFAIHNGTSVVAEYEMAFTATQNLDGLTLKLPASALSHTASGSSAAAGTYTYKIQAKLVSGTGGATVYVSNCVLIAYEI